MKTQGARHVLDALQAGGQPARFVGGCVRDAIVKRPVKDIDIATPEPPEKVMELLRAANIRAIPTGIAHGTVTALDGEERFEVTTLRHDVETFGRHARVAFTDDWAGDAARRDFTMNALYLDLDGTIYDPAKGLKDLKAGKVRFVGDPETRIKEDVLRLLRFFRFLAEYGRYPVNREALEACRKLAPRLPTLSGERIRGELFRILTAPNPADTITKMRAERVLEYVLPEAGDVGRLRMTVWLVERAVRLDGIGIDPVRRLAALLKPDLDPQAVLAIAERLKFSNAERSHLLGMCAAQPAILESMDDRAIRQACHAVGASLVVDRALLAWAGELAIEAHLPKQRTAAWVHIIETAHAWKPIDFPLRGRDVQALGVNHGVRIGQLLKAVEQWWRDEDFRPDRDACLDKLDSLIQGDV